MKIIEFFYIPSKYTEKDDRNCVDDEDQSVINHCRGGIHLV